MGRCCSLVFNSDQSKVVDPPNDDKDYLINSVFIKLDSCNVFQTVLFGSHQPPACLSVFSVGLPGLYQGARVTLLSLDELLASKKK